MLPSFCTETVTRVRPGSKYERGSLVPDWSAEAVSEETITGCSIQPASTTLSQDGRVLGISEQLTAYLPESADVQAGDRIIYNGEPYTIQGEPRIWKAAVNLSHMQLTLIKWEG